MRRIVSISPGDVRPDSSVVREAMGGERASPQTTDLIEKALRIYEDVAAPQGVYDGVSRERFEAVYEGEGRNADRTPVADICAKARCFALFVATVGEPVSRLIQDLFARRDFALGYVLDAVASRSAERAADLLEEECAREYENEGAGELCRLRFSPGYCGWDVSGQRRLFDHLRPSDIGVSLTASCLMCPLKSVSGVILIGPAHAFDVDPTYPCCETCRDRSCRSRMPAPMNDRARREER